MNELTIAQSAGLAVTISVFIVIGSALIAVKMAKKSSNKLNKSEVK